MIDALRHASVDDLAATLGGQARGAQRAAPVAPVAQVRAAARLADDDVLLLRDHLDARLTSTERGLLLRSRAGELALTSNEEAAIQHLLNDGRTAVGELGDHLARRLVLGAVAVVADRSTADPL